MGVPAQPLLEVIGLTVGTTHGTLREVLKDICLSVFPGEMLGVVGESRAGKTVLGLSLLNVLPPELRIKGGAITFKGQNLLRKPEKAMREIRGRDISMIVSGGRSALNPLETVGLQIQHVIRSHREVSRATAEKMTVGMLNAVGINDPERRLHAYPHELSGGMAQRILIAQAMVCEPEMLIADEPTSDLDVTVAAQVLDQMKELIDKKNAATVLLTRDLGIIAQYCDRIAVLNQGDLVEYASVTSFFRAAQHPYSQTLLAAAVAARSHESNGSGAIPAGLWNKSRRDTTEPRLGKNSVGPATGIQDSPNYVQISEQHFVRRF